MSLLKKTTSGALILSTNFYKNSTKAQRAISWAGSKFNLIPQLFPFLEAPNKVYIEPFVGSGSVWLNLPKAFDEYRIGDINENLVNMFRCLICCRKKFCSIVENISCCDFKTNRKNFDNLKQTYNNLQKKTQHESNEELNDDTVLKAACFWALTQTCINNSPRFNKNGGFNQSWGKRNTDFSKLKVLNLPTGTIKLYAGSWQKLVDKAGSDCFIFVDPPYLIENDDYYYRGGWNKDAEEELLLALLKSPANWTLTNFARKNKKVNEPLHDILKQSRFSWYPLNSKHKAQPGKRKKSYTEEVVVTNWR